MGNFVGIITDKDPTVEFSSVTIRAMNGTTALGSSESIPIVSSLDNGTYMVGFKTSGSGNFNGVRLSFGLDAPSALAGCETRTRTLGIKNAFQVKYCPEEQNDCNLTVKANLPDQNVSVTSSGGFVVPVLDIPYGANDVSNVISPSADDYGTISFYLASLAPAWIQVKDQRVHPKGTFAGFEIENNDIVNVSLLGDISITTYLNGAQKETKSAANLFLSGGLLQSSGKKTLGFITDHDDGFNEVRITISGVQLGASTTRVYNAVFRRLCEADPLACNTPVRITSSNYPVAVNMVNTGVDGTFGINNQVVGADNILDENATSPAQIILPANLLAAGKISIKKGLSNYPAGAYVGFDISRPVLAGVGLLQGLKIRTFLNGSSTPAEEVSESGLLAVNTSVLSGTARRIVGFIPTQPFDEIQLVVEQAANVTLGTTSVHSFLIQKFCESEDDLACNNPTPATIPENPVYINARNTGVDALACVGCSINNTQNIIDGESSTYASVILAAGADIDASVSVANALEEYPVNSFAGFEIGTATLLSADILSSIQINLYNNGNPTPVKTVSSAGLLLSATSSLLDGELNRQLIGIVSDVAFDEAQIVFKQTGVDLGTIRIYNALFTGSCASPPITCNSSYYLTQTAFPVYINPARTGTSGIGNVNLGGLRDAWNVVSSETTDYAVMGFAGNVDALAQTSISVVDALNVYPAGTVAGFTISVSPSLVDLGLFSALTVNTYLNGAPAGSSSLGSLIDLELLGLPIFGSGSGIYNLGFVTTQPFNEIQIVASKLADVDLINQIRVYGAFVDTRTATGGGSLTCITTNPDINVAYINKTVSGNVSTNDYVGGGQTATYGTPVPGSNPNSDVPVMGADGSYTFMTSTPGVYTFEIPVCPSGQTVGCPTETLTITVLDPSQSDNPPVANVDLVNMTGSQTGPVTPVLIDVAANDKPGNVGGTLAAPSIGTPPSNGNATIVDGKVQYTPNPGFYGEDVFTYEICEDPSNLCREAEVIVNVLPPGASAVIASDDYNRTTIGAQLSAPAAGVLINDRDAAGGAITVTTTTVSNSAGTVTFSQDGSYVYAPDPSFTGTGVFPYQARNAAGVTASATLYLSVYDPSALPVTLSGFFASKEADAAHLSWTTTGEQNSERFEVERSIEGKNWHRLGSVPASGTSNIDRRYNYVDANPAEGINYYRLKMVDKDGTSALSQVRSVSFALASEISVTPNPAVENLKLKVRDRGSVEKVELISATGQVLYRSGADPLADINVRHLPAGMYILNITRTGGRISTHKVLKN